MVLVKLDALSTTELKSIAAQEEIENYDSLDRDELIIALTEKYQESDDEYSAELDTNPNTRYLSGITDYREIDEHVRELPGVQALPSTYTDSTSLHLLYKNTDWGYVFWNISDLDWEKINTYQASLLLNVYLKFDSGEVEKYDIPIREDDKEWNISLPHKSGVCRVALLYETKDGKRDELTSAKPLILNSSYYLDNKDEIKTNENLISICLSLITTKEGDYLHTPLVNEIVEEFIKEGE